MINRHNYEEYFLLYIDNELSATARAFVERFILQNPDVAAELDVLKQLRLPLENNLHFDRKDILYQEESGMSLANYHEYFLLGVDNELDEHHTNELQKFVLQHPQLQEEYSLLKQATLSTETVEFKDKSVLYRTEKNKRTIPTFFVRMTAAAITIGIVATLWMINQNAIKEVSNPGALADQKVDILPKKEREKKIADAVRPEHIATLHNSGRHGKKIGAFNAQSIMPKQGVIIPVKVVGKPAKDDSVVNNHMLAGVDLPKATIPILTVPKKILDSIPGVGTDYIVSMDNIAGVIHAESLKPVNDKYNVKQAVYHEIFDYVEDNSVYIGVAEFNKAKLKGLLRRAVNFVDRKNNKSEPEKTVQIASFQIRTR